jgi:putative membrane protein
MPRFPYTWGAISETGGLNLLADALYAYLHFAAILTLASALGAEALLLRAQPAARTLLALARTDLLYGLSAAAVIATGAARVLLGAQPAGFYASNPVFWTKLGLVVLIGLVSILPTRRILRWRKALRADASFLPAELELDSTRRLVFAELHLLALVPLPAVLMARGIGL